MKFPKRLYIHRDPNTDSECFLADERFYADCEDGTKVAVYQLVEVKTLKIENSLV